MELPDRQTIRLTGFDYAQSGYYFVTICTYGRRCLFGEIKNGAMILNDYGQILQSIWYSLPKHHRVKLDICQIMPNHIHFIIQLMGESGRKVTLPAGRQGPAPTVGMIVGFLKSETTKQIKRISVGATRGSPDLFFPGSSITIWQRNYWDRIIRNEREYRGIGFYILNNPVNWGKDVLFV